MAAQLVLSGVDIFSLYFSCGRVEGDIGPADKTFRFDNDRSQLWPYWNIVS